MTTLVHAQANNLSPVWLAGIAAVGFLLLFVALKLGRMILRLALGLIGLALLGGAVWWFFLRPQ